MTTASEVVQFCINLANAGTGVDKDGAYGMQCADLPCYIAKHWFGVDLWGNAIDLLDAAAHQGWEVHRMPTEANPRAGAVFVMAVDSHPYGHTGVVIADSDGLRMDTVEQNIDGNADALYNGAPARFNNRTFHGVTGWFYPPYSEEGTIPTSHEPSTSDEIELVKEDGTFTLDEGVTINVRTAPNLEAEVVAIYCGGQRVHYDSKGSANGYRWISYIGLQSGERRYMAIGQTDENGNRISLWGQLS